MKEHNTAHSCRSSLYGCLWSFSCNSLLRLYGFFIKGSFLTLPYSFGTKAKKPARWTVGATSAHCVTRVQKCFFVLIYSFIDLWLFIGKWSS